MILLIIEGNEKTESSYYLAIAIDTQATHHIVATEKQEESQLTECFWFLKVIRGQNNYQEKGCTEIQ